MMPWIPISLHYFSLQSKYLHSTSGLFIAKG
jgi:hypothetical protein